MKEVSYKLFFKAISNTTRFKIIQLLRKHQKNVSQICRELNFEQSRVSHNMKALVACGFVHYKWHGKNKIYSLDEQYIAPILKNIDKHIEKYDKRLKGCGILKGGKVCKYVKEV